MPATAITDAHVHAYPAEVAADPASWARDHGERGWSALVAPPGRRSLQGWADPDAMVADMDEAGIESCVMLGWYWERQETCELQNAWHLDWVRRHPGRLIGFAAAQPAAGQRAVDAAERALDSGLCGIGEILPQAQGFAIDDPCWERIVALAAARQVPVTLHVTDPLAGPAAGPPTPLGGYLELAHRHPTVAFILAHWGGGLAQRGHPTGGEVPANVYFDTAASPLLYGPEVFRQAVGRVGADRILFGSDYPLLVHPRETRRPGFTRFLRDIAAAGLSEGERAQVLGANIRRLLAPGLAQARKRV
jgi:hypothetical protein